MQGPAAAAFAACTTLASASVFYKFDIVDETGPGVGPLGTGPAVSEKGKVAYIGRTTTSTTANASVFV